MYKSYKTFFFLAEYILYTSLFPASSIPSSLVSTAADHVEGLCVCVYLSRNEQGTDPALVRRGFLP